MTHHKYIREKTYLQDHQERLEEHPEIKGSPQIQKRLAEVKAESLQLDKDYRTETIRNLPDV